MTSENEEGAHRQEKFWFFFQTAETNNLLNYQFKIMDCKTVI